MHEPTRWHRRRMAFNHDWLKNQFCIKLGKGINVLAGRIKDPAFADSFLPEVVAGWRSHRGEAFALAASFEDEMSPRALFRRRPLSLLPPEAQWLPDLMHALWLFRYAVPRLAKQASEAAERGDQAFADLQRALAVRDSPGALTNREALVPFVQAFRLRCEELARAIEEFPSEVKVL